MSSITAIDQNIELRNSLIQDVLSDKFSLEDLSKKYNIELLELFLWFKNLEIKLHQTIEQPAGLFPSIDDEEWTSMSEEEKKAFVLHLKEADKFESKTLTINDLKKIRREKKRKNA